MKIKPKFSEPEGEFQWSLLPLATRIQRAEAEQREAQTEHSVHAEQRRVTVDGSQVESLHVIEGDGRIDEEAE